MPSEQQVLTVLLSGVIPFLLQNNGGWHGITVQCLKQQITVAPPLLYMLWTLINLVRVRLVLSHTKTCHSCML